MTAYPLLAISRNQGFLALNLAFLHLSRLLAARWPFPARANKGTHHEIFGTVKSFDITQGRDQIEQETGGNDLPFEKGAIAWGNDVDPILGQRLSYDVGIDTNRQLCALNLQTI